MSTETHNEKWKKRLLEVVDKDIHVEVDGFSYYFPTGSGFLASHDLREIADELDRRNKDWSDEIDRYLNNSPVEVGNDI